MTNQPRNIVLQFSRNSEVAIVQTQNGRRCRVQFFGDEPVKGDILLGDIEGFVADTVFNQTQGKKMHILVDDID